MPATFKAAPIKTNDGGEIWIIRVDPAALATPKQVQSLPQGMSKVFPHRFVLACQEESGKLRFVGRENDLDEVQELASYDELLWVDITVPLLTELE